MHHRIARMEVVQPTDVSEFLERAAQLLADEARHNLILGHRRHAPRRARPLSRARAVARRGRGRDRRRGAADARRTTSCSASGSAGGAGSARARRGPPASPGPSAPCRRSTTSSPPARRLHGVTPEPRVRAGHLRARHRRVPPPAPAQAAARGDAGRPRAARPLVGRVRRRGARCARAGRRAEPPRTSTTSSTALPGTGSRSGRSTASRCRAVGYGQPDTDRRPDRARLHAAATHRGRGYASALTAQVSAEQTRRRPRASASSTPTSPNPTSNRIYVRDRLPARLRLGPVRVRLERDVPVLALRPRLALRQRDLERRDQHRPRPPRLDHVVDVAALGGVVRVGEALLVVGDQLGAARLRIVGLLELLAEDDVDGALRAPSPRPRPSARRS